MGVCTYVPVTQTTVSSSVRPSTPFSADTDTPFLLSTDADMLQERTWRSVTDRSKAADAAAATNNSGGAADGCSGGGCL